MAKGGDFRPAWLVRACEAMRAEENLQAGLPRMLQLAMVSHGHLARSMATHYGTTPVEFISQSRLERSAVLLATTAESIGRIAERCGFTSQSYFGRRFRQRYDQTPREYRDHARRAVVPSRPRHRARSSHSPPGTCDRALTGGRAVPQLQPPAFREFWTVSKLHAG